jgi:hypothetical protein
MRHAPAPIILSQAHGLAILVTRGTRSAPLECAATGTGGVPIFTGTTTECRDWLIANGARIGRIDSLKARQRELERQYRACRSVAVKGEYRAVSAELEAMGII